MFATFLVFQWRFNEVNMEYDEENNDETNLKYYYSPFLFLRVYAFMITTMFNNSGTVVYKCVRLMIKLGGSGRSRILWK